MVSTTTQQDKIADTARLRRCAITGCPVPADWAWQPFGPDDTPLCFTTLGSHARGFPTLPICDHHRDRLRAGHIESFAYRRIPYAATRHGVTPVEVTS